MLVCGQRRVWCGDVKGFPSFIIWLVLNLFDFILGIIATRLAIQATLNCTPRELSWVVSNTKPNPYGIYTKSQVALTILNVYQIYPPMWPNATGYKNEKKILKNDRMTRYKYPPAKKERHIRRVIQRQNFADIHGAMCPYLFCRTV